MWMFPRSVPMYNHLLWKGRWQKVILWRQKEKKKRRQRVKKGSKEGSESEHEEKGGQNRQGKRDRKPRDRSFSKITRQPIITRDKLCKTLRGLFTTPSGRSSWDESSKPKRFFSFNQTFSLQTYRIHVGKETPIILLFSSSSPHLLLSSIHQT